MASVVNSPVSFLRHITLRCAFCFSCILRSRGLLVLSFCPQSLQDFTAPRPGIRRRSHVDLRNHYFPGSRGRHHNRNSFTPRNTLARHSRIEVSQNCRPALGYLEAGDQLVCFSTTVPNFLFADPIPQPGICSLPGLPSLRAVCSDGAGREMTRSRC